MDNRDRLGLRGLKEFKDNLELKESQAILDRVAYKV